MTNVGLHTRNKCKNISQLKKDQRQINKSAIETPVWKAVSEKTKHWYSSPNLMIQRWKFRVSCPIQKQAPSALPHAKSMWTIWQLMNEDMLVYSPSNLLDLGVRSCKFFQCHSRLIWKKNLYKLETDYISIAARTFPKILVPIQDSSMKSKLLGSTPTPISQGHTEIVMCWTTEIDYLLSTPQRFYTPLWMDPMTQNHPYSDHLSECVSPSNKEIKLIIEEENILHKSFVCGGNTTICEQFKLTLLTCYLWTVVEYKHLHIWTEL